MATKKKTWKEKPPKLKMKQIAIGQWEGKYEGGITYSVIGLSTEGQVYRYSVGIQQWVPYSQDASMSYSEGGDDKNDANVP